MSKSVGIVAEYNPFHTGHRYQIDFLKKKGFENIIIAMSGSCVQRGEPALLSKFIRCEMALKNGADLVAEIPYPFSCRSAEGYAMAGMQTLKSMGVDAVSFGSESGNTALLEEIADYLLSDEYENAMKEYLAENIPFASAREKAIFDRFDINRDIVSASNDILAVEYIKACRKLDWKPEFIAVKRVGAGYNTTEVKSGFASASGIRKMLSEYRQESALSFIPEESRELLARNMDRGSFFMDDDSFEKAVLFALQSKTAEDFVRIPDCNTELANSFEKAVCIASDFESLMNNLPTKRYTRARLKRIILAAFLNVYQNMPYDIQYIRILGFRTEKESVLKKISKECSLPVSHSAKILSEKSELCRKVVEAESRACDAQAIFSRISQQPRADYTSRIIKI